MASCSGNSSSAGGGGGGSEGSTETEIQVLMDQRKRKRMQSNRESARRSRMRKQKHLDDLMSQVNQLKKENNQILTTMNLTTQQFLNVEAENSVLRAQMMELTHRLQSLDDILICMNSNSAMFDSPLMEIQQQSNIIASSSASAAAADNFLNINPWNLMYLNQPIMASAHDIFQY